MKIIKLPIIMRTIISMIITLVFMIVLLKFLWTAKPNGKDVGGELMEDLGRTARELKEDFDRGFHKKDTIKIDSSRTIK